jgi:hypothetical protein
VLVKGDMSRATGRCWCGCTRWTRCSTWWARGPRGRAGEFGDAMRLIAAEGRGVLVLLRDLTMKLAPGR